MIDQLRRDGDLTLSLVAEVDGQIVGHVAFSPATIGDASKDWFGLGPVAVSPDVQKQGIGQRLIKEGLAQLRAQGALGCLLTGDPNYYSRFGFVGDCGITYDGLDATFVQALAFEGSIPKGVGRFAPALSED